MSELRDRAGEWADLFIASPMLAITLTLSAFLAGNWLVQRLGRPVWCPPVLLAAALLGASLAVLAIDVSDYQQGARWITVLLGPATVALGVPLYQQIHHVRAMWKPILFVLPVAAALAAVYAIVIAGLLGASPEVLASMAPKSVTAPIAIGITEQLGGSVSLMMGGLLVTGVVATVCTDFLARRMSMTDERILGLVLGLNGHAIGTVRAFEMSATAGAFASLGMGLTGICTALILPLAFQFMVF